jgi:hypothetical protein
MGGINVGRWLAGGVVAGIFTWLFEGAASFFYMEDMETAMEALGLSMEMTAWTWMITVVVSLIVGLSLVFFYAAARPRFGPGPGTAIKMAIAVWFVAHLLPIIGYGMIGMYPTGLLAMWAVIGVVELILASLIGGWIYREGEPA